MIIHSIVPHLTFQVECKPKEETEAEKIMQELITKLLKLGSKGINQKFADVKVMQAYLDAL